MVTDRVDADLFNDVFMFRAWSSSRTPQVHSAAGAAVDVVPPRATDVPPPTPCCCTVLFLDEPTSGLDSRSSSDVCNALRAVADLGLTVAAVIHQPRYESE